MLYLKKTHHLQDILLFMQQALFLGFFIGCSPLHALIQLVQQIKLCLSGKINYFLFGYAVPRMKKNHFFRFKILTKIELWLLLTWKSNHFSRDTPLETQTRIYCKNTTNNDFILPAVRSLLRPITAPLGNFSAWQQPFWERISKGHRTDLLNLELEFTHRHTCKKSTRENIERVKQVCARQRHTAWTENADHWRGSGCLPVSHPPTHLASL